MFRWKPACLALLASATLLSPAVSVGGGLATEAPAASAGEFDRPVPVLRRLVRASGKARRPNDFCIVDYSGEDGPFAWVYWRQANRLILWEPQVEPVADLTLSRRKLDLRKDVVESRDAVGGSSYIVTRDWLHETLRDCETRGRKVRLN